MFAQKVEVVENFQHAEAGIFVMGSIMEESRGKLGGGGDSGNLGWVVHSVLPSQLHSVLYCMIIACWYMIMSLCAC